jgi:pilin isopeptide linkage protein
MKRTKIRNILLSALLALTVGMPQLSFAEEAAGAGASGDASAPQAAGDKSAVADPSTIWDWTELTKSNTANVGRIWTDKTVSTGDMTEEGVTVQKGDGAFLTALTAISSTSNLLSTSTTPLDIVLVLDASGSMDDPIGGRDSTKRIDALKTAANSFIDQIAEQNEGVNDAAKQHQVAIVKFAGNKTEKMGNDTYQDGGFTYNYSQVMKNMAACTNDAKKGFTSTVNSISPAGATNAGAGMELAVSQTSSRSDAKKVVVFFTDGTPTDHSEWSDSVASSAVTAAKGIKDAGGLVYSIGIFNGANPSSSPTASSTSKVNKFMHAVSSNYPAATYSQSRWNYTWTFGDRAKDSSGADAAFYKSATNADELKRVFDDISKEIVNNAGYPTKTAEGFENQSGYIDFTDRLGAYMQVRDLSKLVYNGTVYESTDKTTEGNIDTYHFSGDVHSGAAAANLSDIIVAVTRSSDAATGDIVRVKVPATLIPLHNYSVDLKSNTMTEDQTTPVSVLYTSDLKDEARELMGNPDEAMQRYIDANTDSATGKVRFYANAWNGGGLGDATAAFEPAKTNSYYYFTQDTPIYTDEACTQRAASVASGSTYYYKHDYYELNGGKPLAKSASISFKGGDAENFTGAIAVNGEGAYFKVGTARLTYLNELHAAKKDNPTSTASDVLNPKWNSTTSVAAATQVTSHLGNNGLLLIEKPGALAVGKALEMPEGYERADFANDAFTFEIAIANAANKKFSAEVRDAKGELAGTAFKITFDGNGKVTHSVKDGETLYIFGLDGGWEYSVSEQPKAGFTQVFPVDDDGAPVAASGTIPAGSQAKAEFVNGYHPTGTLVGGNSLVVHKVLEGRNWSESDNFRFVLNAVTSDAPMPLDNEGKPVSAITLTRNNSTGAGYAMGAFGNITYTKPGTYVYEISEDQSVGAEAGMSLSQAHYKVVVTVTKELAGQGDNAVHQGKLNVSSVMVQTKDDDGASVQSDDGVDAATFTNEFVAREAKWSPAVKKEYTDNSGANPLEDGMFNFRIDPVEGSPMPVNPIGAVNADGSVTFEVITFTGDMIGKSFQYRITEVVRGANGDWINVADSAAKSYLQPGMTYDESTWTVTVKVTGQKINGEQVVVCEASYAKPIGGGEVVPLDQAKFVNSYTPKSVSVPAEGFVAGTKILTGRDMRTSETFGFALEPADDATKAAIDARTVTLGKTTATVSGGKSNEAMSFDFDGATFAKPGTYTFTVRENAWDGNALPEDGTGGMTFDRHEAVIKITVTDNKGILRAARTVENPLSFANRFTAAGDYPGLVVSKTLTGRNMAAGEFSFTIAGADDASKRLLSDDGTRTFNNAEERGAGFAYEATLLTDLHFTQDDAGKTFTFDVFENVPTDEAPGMTYDKKKHRVAISVASDDAGALVITTTVDGRRGWNKVSFTNAYTADPVTFDTQAGFGLYKVLEGRDWEAYDEFSFLLEPLTEGAPTLESTRATVDAGQVNRETGHAPISFGDITFNQAGVYKYRVTEENAGRIIHGVKYTSNVAEFAVTVTDVDAQGVHTGKLEANAQLTTTPNTLEFTNLAGFEYDDNQIPVNAFKRFVNNSAVSMPDMTGLFTFELTAAEANAPMPVATTAHNGADGSIDFGVITFGASLFDNGSIVISSAPAAAKSAASESNAADKAVASDVPAADAAAASEAGALATGAGDAAKGEGSASADAGAVPADDAAAVPAAKPAGDGPTTDNPPAEASMLVFHYTITEKAGGHADVVNDPNPAFTFEVTVTRDNAGNVTANVTNVQDYVKGMPLRTFTNTYTYTPYTPPVIPDPDPIFAAPVAKKILEGRALVAGEFSFELLENGKVVSTGTNDADGNVAFSDIKFTEAGTHIYTMREIGAGTTAAGVTYDATTYQVTADVVEIDNELRVDFAIDGADGAVFKNAYAAKGTTVIIGATKTLEGRTLAAGEFTFKLTGADGRTYEAKNAADGRIEFPAIDFDKVGTYDFTLVEMNDGQAGITYDGRSYKVTVVVTDDGKGNLVANVTWPNGTPPTFKNTYTKPVPAVTPGTPGKPPARFAKTGDETMPIACVATLAILAAGAVGAAVFGALRKREKGDERQ